MTDQPGLDASIFGTIVETGGAQTRVQLASELACLIGDDQAPEEEREGVIPTVLKLAADPDKEVRRALAEGLVSVSDLHGDVVFSIIADDDDIALPFLGATPALDHWKMRSIARVGDAARQVTLARRPDLDDDVIKEIVTQADLCACLALFENKNCKLSDRHCRILYARFGREQQVIEKLLSLDTLPPDIRIMQAKRAASQVHQLMAERGWVPANDAAEMIADAEERVMLRILCDASEKELAPLISFMTERGMLTASIVMRSACAGNMPIVETVMAHLAGTSRARARDVLCGGGAGFTSLYRNSGLPSTCIGLISAAGAIEGELRDMKITLNAENFGRRLIEQIMTGDGAMSQAERAKYLDLISRYSGERVRTMAERLRQGLLAAA